MSIESAERTLAVVAAWKKKVATIEDAAKAELMASGRRTGYPADDEGAEMATVVVKRVGSDDPVVTTTDESELFAFMVDQFGDGSVETVTRLSSQGTADLKAAAKRAWPDGEPIPGALLSDPPPKRLSVSVTPAKNVVELVDGMTTRGVLDFAAVLTELPEAARP